MQNMRSPDRCIILTTHHLEEAEALSQKIGIMSHGKLVIIGDCNFIQDHFSVGYHVIFSFEEGKLNEMETVSKKILLEVKGAKKDEQTALNTIKFILPVSSSSQFGSLFG